MNFDLIIQSLSKNINISKNRRGSYIFIEQSTTKINGIFFEHSIHYRISDLNSKRITYCLIRSVYDYYQLNNRFPTRAQLRDFFPVELSSRPCNYAVACAIVSRFVK
jgi:hypothetical protein